MFSHRITQGVALAGLLSLAQPAISLAQNMPSEKLAAPTRIGNIWGGLNHQPKPAEVAPLEERAGIAPPNQQQKLDQEIAQLTRELLSRHVPTDITSGTGRC
jgi:hypothetical protein